jgi:hypothetical protein
LATFKKLGGWTAAEYEEQARSCYQKGRSDGAREARRELGTQVREAVNKPVMK